MKTLNLIYFGGHDFDHRNVTIGLVESTFLLVVNVDHESILHRYGDMGPQRYWGHDLDLLGSRDVIGHVTIGLGKNYQKLSKSDNWFLSDN